MKIALILDNPFRDLPGMVLLARQLCRSGATVYLVPSNLRDREVWSLAPDFVLMNHLRTVNQEFARASMDAGIQVGVLDTEGGLLTHVEDFGNSMAPDASVRHRICGLYSWGSKIVECAASKGWYLPEQMFVTGHPRFDYYVPPLREAALAISSYADEYARPMVLINGNFPFANPRFKTPESELSMRIERFNYDPQEAVRWQRTQRETMRGLAGLANSLAARFPAVRFVYRPHPFEKLETYEELLERRDNLHAVKKGTADGWILRASAVIQRSCSTAVEAGLAGVPALSPRWIPVHGVQPSAEAVSIPCASEGELFERVAEAVEGRLTVPEPVRRALDEVIGDWFHAIDGRSHERVAERILVSLRDGRCGVNLKRCRRVVYGRGRKGAPFTSRVASRVREALGVSVHWSFRRWRHEVPDLDWHRTEKYYDAAAVRAVMEAIESASGRGGACRIEVASAKERGDYHFGYMQGRSVTLFPTS